MLATAPGSLAAALHALPSDGLAAFAAAVRRACRGRRDLAHLRELDDHMLADIGLRRDQLHDAVLHGRRRGVGS